MAANTGLFGMGVIGTVVAAAAGIVTAGYVAREAVFAPQGPQISLEVPERGSENDAPAGQPEVGGAAFAPSDDDPGTAPAVAEIRPAFDIVRVDSDGTAVVAGTAEAGSTVTLYLDGAFHQDAGVGPDGKFALFLFIAPSPGPQTLTMKSNLNGREVWADDQIILAPLPEAEEPEPPMAEVADAVVGDAALNAENSGDLVASADLKDDAVSVASEPEQIAQIKELVTRGAEVPDASDEAPGETSVVEKVDAEAEELASLSGPEPDVPTEEFRPQTQDVEVEAADTEAGQHTPDSGTDPIAAKGAAEPAPTQADSAPLAVAETVATESAPQTEPELVSEPLSTTPPVSETMARAPSELAGPPMPSTPPPDVEAMEAPDLVTAIPAGPVPDGPESPPGPEQIPAPLPQRAQTPTADVVAIADLPPSTPAPERDAPELTADLPENPVVEAPAAPPGPEVDPAPKPRGAAGPAVPGAPDAPETPVEEPRDFAAAPAPQPRSGGVAVIRAGRDGVELLQPANPQRPDALERLALDTISYSEAGEVQLSGRAPEGAAIRVYLDNRAVADLPIDAQGRWKGELGDVRPGVYTLRLDQVAADGRVGGRIETPFKREAPAVLDAARADLPPDAPSVAVVTVQQGDTLWAISRENYGTGFMYVRVFEANRETIRNPDLIYPGQIFSIPN